MEIGTIILKYVALINLSNFICQLKVDIHIYV